MKKILPILLILLFSSCKKEVPLTFSEYNFASEEQAIIEVNIPKFDGNTEISNAVNSAIENYVTKSILSDDELTAMSVEDAAKIFDVRFMKFNEAISESLPPWETFVDGEVTYQSSEIISVAINSYTNTGGAHGNSVISFLNFNPSTGELYKTEDLVNTMESFKIIAESHFKKMIQEREDSDEFDFQFPETIGFNEDGIIILLNSNGLIIDSPEFIIPYEKVNDLLKVH